MLISAHIHKFLSCEDVEIKDFGDITAFIGRNGAGKTNILKAIEAAAKVISENNFRNISLFNEGVTLRFKFLNKIYRFTVKMEYRENPDDALYYEELSEELASGESISIFSNKNENVLIEGRNLSYPVHKSVPMTNAVLSSGMSNKHRLAIAMLVNFSSSIRYYDTSNANEFDDDISGVVFAKDYTKWRSSIKIKNDIDHPTIFKLIHLWQSRKEVFEELLSLLGHNGLDLIDSVDIQEVKSKSKISHYSLYFTPVGSCEDVNFVDLSFGTRRIVRLLTSMLYDKASVALIEQPEDGIHPGLLHKIIPLLRSYANPNQFIITSHSPDVLNMVKPEEIRMVGRKDGKTVIRVLNEKEIEIAREFMENEGALSEFIESIEER